MLWLKLITQKIIMDIGTGIAILGVWVFTAAAWAAPQISEYGNNLAIRTSTLWTLLLILKELL